MFSQPGRRPSPPNHSSPEYQGRRGKTNDSGTRMDVRPTLSIVIPCYNEAHILERSCRQLIDYLEHAAWSGNLPRTWEIIYVNDGSHDQTDAIVAAMNERDPRVRLCTYPN